jgi:hypothetical protein
LKINQLVAGAFVKSQRLPKESLSIGRPIKKPLGVRYAEVLRLREAILQAKAESKRRQIDRRISE